jgi:hypothetical protein
VFAFLPFHFFSSSPRNNVHHTPHKGTHENKEKSERR